MSVFFRRAPGLLCIFSILGLGIVILADRGSNKLEAFARVQLPALVVSCKCDAPQRQINPNSIEQVGTVSGYETMQTSAASPDSQKKCVNMVLSMIIKKNGLCPSLLLFTHFFTVAWRLLLCAGLHFAYFRSCPFWFRQNWITIFSHEPAGWRNVCFVSVTSTTFLIRYLFFYLVACTCGKGDTGRWRINHPSCHLASAAASMRSFHSMPAHPPVLNVRSLLKGKGQGYSSMAFSDFTASSFSSLLLSCFPGRAHLGCHFIIAKC